MLYRRAFGVLISNKHSTHWVAKFISTRASETGNRHRNVRLKQFPHTLDHLLRSLS